MATVIEPPQTFKELVGRNIVFGRRLAGVSQQQLAERLIMDRRDLSKWETGHRQPNEANLRRVADALGQPVAFFFTPHEDGRP